MMDFLGQLRYWLLSTHNLARSSVREVLTMAVIMRLLVSGSVVIGTNLNSFRTGTAQQREANWNGAAYLILTNEAKQAMRNLAHDTGGVVELYAINYRLPGHYHGIFGTDGQPEERYASRNFQWLQMQRSECSNSDQGDILDPIERSKTFEMYCPINYGELSLPVGFMLIRWEKRPKTPITPIKDRLWDTGRLISR